MKLLRYGALGEERPGLVDVMGNIRDLSYYLTDIDPETLRDPLLLAELKAVPIAHLPIVSSEVRIGACIRQPGKIICAGLNSGDHAKALGLNELKKEVLLFLKPSSSISGPFDPIMYTPLMKKLDWEAELAIVIGKKGKYISKTNAGDYIFGYTCMNDLSERYWQLETEDHQFTKGKGFDGAAPLGPYVVTRDELSDTSALNIMLSVNGVLRQSFNTGSYRYNDCELVSYVSQFFTLYPGDVIAMGSGPGNAASYGEDAFLKPNDCITLSIDQLGQQQQTVMKEERPQPYDLQ